MEKIRNKPENKELRQAFKQIEDEAMGNPILLKATPKKKDVKANNIAAYEDKIYIRLANGKLIQLSGTEITE